MSRKSNILVTIGTELSQTEGEPVLLAKEKMEFLIFTRLNEGVIDPWPKTRSIVDGVSE